LYSGGDESSSYFWRIKKARKTFLPQSSAHNVRMRRLRGPYYPYNISGSYEGTGNLNYTQNGNSSWMDVTSYLRIKMAVTGSGRYHATQIQIKLDPVINKRQHIWTESDGNPKFMLLALGIYDSLRGRIQAIANSPTYPPKLPMFKHRNIRYPETDWIVSPMEGFEPNKCQFLVDIAVNNIGLKAYVKDRRTRKKQKKNAAMRTFEHIDVHVKATIRNMNASCSDVTQSTVTGDLLRYDKFILKSARYAQVAAGLSFIQLLIM